MGDEFNQKTGREDVKSFRKMKNALLAICTLLALVPASFAQIVINSASINYAATPNQITVNGTGFCPRRVLPHVTFDAVALKVTSACSNTTLTANLPASVAAGSYNLEVDNGTPFGLAFFDVTYGSVGPQGVIGPVGATGPQGPQGLQGAASTVPGPTGPAGATGPAGLVKAYSFTNTGAINVGVPVGAPDVVIGTLTLPAGTFSVSGKLSADDNGDPNAFLQCALVNSPDPLTPAVPVLDTAWFYNPGVTAIPGTATWVTTIPLQGFVTSASGTIVTMQCFANSAANINVLYVQMAAVQVSTLNQ